MTDKERDDALITEAYRRSMEDAEYDKTLSGSAILELRCRHLLRLERSGWKPKPDRAEVLAWMIEGLFAEAADNPCTCTSDENSCPHCNAWERATKQTRACIVEAIDELRAEWEAERPAVVVPSEIAEALARLVAVIKMAGVGNLSRGVQLGQISWSVKCNDAIEWAEKVLSQIDGAKGGE